MINFEDPAYDIARLMLIRHRTRQITDLLDAKADAKLRGLLGLEVLLHLHGSDARAVALRLMPKLKPRFALKLQAAMDAAGDLGDNCYGHGEGI